MTHTTRPDRDRLDKVVEVIKVEVTSDIGLGWLPPDVASWSALNHRFDANEYGGLCDPARNADLDVDAMAYVQAQIDAWLAAGRP